MRRWLAAGGAIVGLAAVLYALFAAKSDEELIAERLDELELAVQVDSDTSTNPILRTGALGGKFQEIFTEDVTYSIPELTSGDRGRNGLATLAARAGSYFDNLVIDFGARHIDLDGSGKGARVSTTATVTAVRRGGDVDRDERNVRFELEESGEGWRITSVSVAPKDTADETF
jgi:hypothetical protein